MYHAVDFVIAGLLKLKGHKQKLKTKNMYTQHKLTTKYLQTHRIEFDDELSYDDLVEYLIDLRYNNLGSLNAGITLPACPFSLQGKDWDGVEALYVNHDFKLFYTVRLED